MILPQYPTYFDSDTAEKQIEVTRDYLGKLKEALEVEMSHIKLSDMDEDTRDYFENFQMSIDDTQHVLAEQEERLTSLTMLLSMVQQDLADRYIELLTKLGENYQHALRNDNNDSMSNYFADKAVTFKNVFATNYYGSGDISTTNGSISASKNITAGEHISATGDLFAGDDLQIGDTAYIGNQLQVTGVAFLDDQLQVKGISFFYNDSRTFGGNVKVWAEKTDEGTPQESAIGGDIQAIGITIHEGEQNEERIGGSVKAEKFKLSGLTDKQYFRHMTMTVNGQLIHYLGIPDSEFQP
jgi:hypothetical protein